MNRAIKNLSMLGLLTLPFGLMGCIRQQTWLITLSDFTDYICETMIEANYDRDDDSGWSGDSDWEYSTEEEVSSVTKLAEISFVKG